jgi:hypothetical protein
VTSGLGDGASTHRASWRCFRGSMAKLGRSSEIIASTRLCAYRRTLDDEHVGSGKLSG